MCIKFNTCTPIYPTFPIFFSCLAYLLLFEHVFYKMKKSASNNPSKLNQPISWFITFLRATFPSAVNFIYKCFNFLSLNYSYKWKTKAFIKTLKGDNLPKVLNMCVTVQTPPLFSLSLSQLSIGKNTDGWNTMTLQSNIHINQWHCGALGSYHGWTLHSVTADEYLCWKTNKN